MSIAKVRSLLYKVAKGLGDVRAVETGKVPRRIERRLVGRVFGQLLGKLFR